jgi:4-hydroxy-tetrahydrodipicolinate reductase
MTRIVILGYGAMGREIESLAERTGCIVAAIVDVDRPLDPKTQFDVAIDFTEPSVVIDNVRTITGMGRSMVIGTTGWYDDLQVVREVAQQQNVGIVHGTNFSVGVQIFFRLVRAAGTMINDIESYDAAVHEWHHTRKKDSPSGTALTTATILLEEMQRKKRIETETQHERIGADALHVTSTRTGDVVGRHVVTLDSAEDTIEIQHTAKDRRGFAHGALLAARWIHGRTGVHDFSDVFSEIIAGMKA